MDQSTFRELTPPDQSLLDEFARSALKGLLASAGSSLEAVHGVERGSEEHYAIGAYKYALAMMKIRTASNVQSRTLDEFAIDGLNGLLARQNSRLDSIPGIERDSPEHYAAIAYRLANSMQKVKLALVQPDSTNRHNWGM